MLGVVLVHETGASMPTELETVAAAVHDLAGSVMNMSDSLGARVAALESREAEALRRRHLEREPAESSGYVAPDANRGGVGDSALGSGGWLFAALTGGGAGSAIVPEAYRAAVWDRLAPISVATAMGMSWVETETDTLHLPRLTADAAAAWVAESGTITPADPTIGEVIAAPRKLAALVQCSNELLDDSNPAGVQIVQQNLTRSLGLKFDLGVFEGSGSAPEIRGLKNVAGIQTVSLGANGATPTNLDAYADAIGLLAQANANATAIAMHPRSWQTLIKLKEIAGSTKPVLQQSAGAGSAGIERSIYGIPVFLTSQLSITETHGTSTDCSSAYVVQADQIVGVRRYDTRVEVDRSRLFNQDMSEVRAILRADVVVPNPTAIVRVLGIRP